MGTDKVTIIARHKYSKKVIVLLDEKKERGVVFIPDFIEILCPVMSIHSFLKSGYWNIERGEFEVDSEWLEKCKNIKIEK